METKIQYKNNFRRNFRNALILSVLFLVLFAIGLGVFANQYTYSEKDVSTVTGTLEDVTYEDNCCDLKIGERTYRITAKMLEDLDTDTIESLIGEEITISHLGNDPYYFIVGIESSQINISVEDGLKTIKNLAGLVCFAVLTAIVLACTIFFLYKFVKSPATVECDATLFALVKKVEQTPTNKKLMRFTISSAFLIFVLAIVTVILGESNDNSVAFYVFLGLTCFFALAFCICTPFLLRWNRKHSIAYTLDYYKDIEQKAEENNIFYSFPGSYCKFEAEKLTVYSDNDDLFENISANKYQKVVAYKQINFVAKALFKTNGTISIVVCGETKTGTPLIFDLDADLFKIIKDFKIEVSGLEFLISNLSLLMERYKGKLYFVSFDKQGVSEARKISFKEQMKYL